MLIRITPSYNYPKIARFTVLARDIAPTLAGPGEANESQSILQSKQILFSALKE